MKDPNGFVRDHLNTFKSKIDTLEVCPHGFKAIRDILKDEDFVPEKIKTKSTAAAGLCDWILNIVQYYDVVVTVEPKKIAVAQAQETLRQATEKKEEVDALVASLNAKLAVLQAEFQKAMDEKNAAEAEANKCAGKLDRANRLVNALGSESERWAQSIEELGHTLGHITGDVLLAAAFVSYVGPFNKVFRDKIINDFKNFFTINNIPVGPNIDPVSMLTDEAEIAQWNTQGLPSD